VRLQAPSEGGAVNTTKHDLITKVAEQTGLTQSDTKIVVEKLLETVCKFLESQNSIEIRGFGTFYTKMRKPRPARNPKTGEVVPLNKRLVPLFKYSGDMKKKICAALLKKNPV
jgi:integration host factor subunit beta